MSTDILDSLNHNVIVYLEGISDPEKVRLSKRWDKDKDHQTHGPSAPDYIALYEKCGNQASLNGDPGRGRFLLGEIFFSL